MQIPIGDVPEVSGADAVVRMRKVPVERLGEVAEGAHTQVRFRKVPEGTGRFRWRG